MLHFNLANYHGKLHELHEVLSYDTHPWDGDIPTVLSHDFRIHLDSQPHVGKWFYQTFCGCAEGSIWSRAPATTLFGLFDTK